MKGDGKRFALVEDLGEPSLGVGLEAGVGKKWYGEWEIALGWGEIAISQRLVDEMCSSAASGFFQAGGHTANGVDFEVTVSARAQLTCSFEGSEGVIMVRSRSTVSA